jgi:hypothetical protein
MTEDKPAVPAEHEGAGEVSEEAIARRAYEISQREDAGTPEENWRRAEAELRGGQPEADASSA